MVTDNLGLVHLCARRFLGRGMDYDDLFQAGCVGLVKAAEHFEPERGLRFSTYAVPVILGEIRRLFRDGGAMRVSRGLRELAMKAQKAAADIENSTGRGATVEEIAAALDVTVEKAALALGTLRRPLSLTGGEEGEQVEVPVEGAEERINQRLTLREAIGRLEDRDQKLIYYRYYRGLTQVKTAEMLGMTQVQVSRREKKLLAQLRHEME